MLRNFSLLKLSRYFFAWFFAITVVPWLCLMLWNDYHFKKTQQEHQRALLEFLSGDLVMQSKRYLTIQTLDIERIAKTVNQSRLGLEEYKKLFKADTVWWLDSMDAKNFMTQHCGGAWSSSDNGVNGDFCLNQRNIDALFVLPPEGKRRGLLIDKKVPFNLFLPPGPMKVEIYKGKTITTSGLLASLQDPFHTNGKRFHRFIFRRPGRILVGVMDPIPPGEGEQNLFLSPGPRRVEIHEGKTETPSGLLAGLPAPFHTNMKGYHRFIIRRPDGVMIGAMEPISPEREERSTFYKLIPLTNRNGDTIATIRLKMMVPAFPPNDSIQQWMGGIILLTGLIASVFAGYYIHKNFIEPLTQLSVLTHQVQEGDLASRLETSKIKQSEVLQTMDNVNAMLEQLSEKERLRNNFVSNLTHDFRTPLIAQARSLELFIEEFDELALSQQSKLAHSLLKNNEHLLTMVNQLLETYQFEDGKLKLKMESLLLPVVVEQSFEKLMPLAEARNVTLERDFPADFPHIEADRQALTRVFVNLIGNAVENIPKGSLIQITGQCSRPGKVEIHVRDNGPGILQEDLPHLFDRYYAGMGDTRKLGSGLGLYICKMFIEAHHGTIEVDSVPNQYTDFIIRLPLQEGR